jgi:ribonuclease P protein component
MLSQNHRLAEEKEILYSLRSRFSQNDKFFKLVLSRSKIKDFRFCCIVGKKIYKKANKRHRLKRRVLGIIKKILDSKQFKLHYFNCVIQCLNKEAIKINSIEFELEIENLLKLALVKAHSNKPKPSSIANNSPAKNI